jgi:sulfur-oxidizing protein SoxX
MRTAVITLLLAALTASGTAMAQTAGGAPDPKICNATANPPKDAITQGGCIAIARNKGNCDACHTIPGAVSGNIGPSLAGVGRRMSTNALRQRVEDPTRFNPRTVMPPYGRHEILTPAEIDKLLAWLKTL